MHELIAQPKMLLVVIVYLLALVGTGAYFAKKAAVKKEGKEDFFLAGRGLGKIVAVGTILATYTGGGTVTGGGNSLAFNYGLWSGLFFTICPVISMSVLCYLTPKIRESNCYTVSQLLETKYGSKARTISAVIIALAMVSIVSYQYRGLGFILNATTGIPTTYCTIICCALVIVLALSGGLKTVATTDAMSAFLMVGGLAIGLPVLISTVGGWDWVISSAQANDPESLTFFGGQTLLKWVGGYLPLILLTCSDQNYYQRIVAAKDVKTARVGLMGTMLACFVIMPVVACYAFISRQHFGTSIAAGQALIGAATLLPTIIGGIVLSAAAAFTITTGDSYLLSAAANFCIDLYSKINPNATEKEELKVSRAFILIAGIVAYVILTFFPSILAIQYWSYTIYGAGITPAVVGSLIWKKATKAGGISSMIVGCGLSIIWEATGSPFGLQTIFVAFPIALIILIAVSLATQPKSE